MYIIARKKRYAVFRVFMIIFKDYSNIFKVNNFFIYLYSEFYSNSLYKTPSLDSKIKGKTKND